MFYSPKEKTSFEINIMCYQVIGLLSRALSSRIKIILNQRKGCSIFIAIIKSSKSTHNIQRAKEIFWLSHFYSNLVASLILPTSQISYNHIEKHQTVQKLMMFLGINNNNGINYN